jgi:hypothetical protein
VHLAFALLTIITLTVLIFEIAFPTAYVSVFQPGNYYAATGADASVPCFSRRRMSPPWRATARDQSRRRRVNFLSWA